jgi:hypothetical protein
VLDHHLRAATAVTFVHASVVKESETREQMEREGEKIRRGGGGERVESLNRVGRQTTSQGVTGGDEKPGPETSVPHIGTRSLRGRLGALPPI